MKKQEMRKKKKPAQCGRCGQFLGKEFKDLCFDCDQAIYEEMVAEGIAPHPDGTFWPVDLVE